MWGLPSIPPWSLTARPWKVTFPTGNFIFHHFSAAILNFGVSNGKVSLIFLFVSHLVLVVEVSLGWSAASVVDNVVETRCVDVGTMAFLRWVPPAEPWENSYIPSMVVSGSLNRWAWYHIIPQLAVKYHLYTIYILPIGWLYDPRIPIINPKIRKTSKETLVETSELCKLY